MFLSVFEFGRQANRRTVCFPGANRQATLACWLWFLLMTLRWCACSPRWKEHARFLLLFDPDRVCWPHRPALQHAGRDAHVDLGVPGRGAQNPGISGQVLSVNSGVSVTRSRLCSLAKVQ
jgi:hypothetical protein